MSEANDQVILLESDPLPGMDTVEGRLAFEARMIAATKEAFKENSRARQATLASARDRWFD